jgi:phospholipid/cholesterol/gamma-HCH transport system substrate-binding protein
MPRTRSLAWSELKIGVVSIIAIVVAAATIFLVTGSKGFSWQRYPLKVQFANVAGLKPGSPVRVAGVEVGSVDSVDIAGDEVDVGFRVNRNVRPRITNLSVATLGSVSLLGEAAVDITPASGGTPIADGGYVPTGPAAPQLADLTGKASQGIDEITMMVRDLRQGKGTAGKLLTDDELYAELRRFVTTAGDLARSVKEGRGTLGRLVNDPGVANTLQASLKNIEELTRQINSGEGSLGRLIRDDAFARNLTESTAGLKAVMDKLNSGEGTAGKLMTDSTLYNRLTSVATRFDELATHLNEGQGTAGQLLKDRQLYENMNGAVSDLRTLIADIRKDPRKFLNVRVSIF